MISVILPTYNRTNSLRRSVQSVLEQSYKDIELLIVDDGSDDDTAEIVKEIEDERVRYLPQHENRGACAARNVGIRAARGEYIAFQDSDDVWHREKLAAQIHFLQKNDADAVFCAFIRHDGDLTACLPEGLSDGERVTYEAMLEHNFISTQTLMGKSACFRAEQFDEAYPRLQDWELGLRLVRRFKICFDQRPMVEVYVQKDSISKNPRKGMWAIEHLAAQHRKGLKKNPKSAISMAYAYDHFAREAGDNPWPGICRLMKGASVWTFMRAIRVLLKKHAIDMASQKEE